MGAELQEGEETIKAWFTPRIPVAMGPQHYFGLPGLILAIERNEEIVIMATEINLNPSEAIEVNPPDKGQKMNSVNFQEVVERKTMEFIKEKEAERKKSKSAGSKKGK